ncbi:MAG: mechanosensitive ion channel family protein [Gemmatimonadetes bacterium]|nr:mechanosensitive ion channel family protein [Gemmatimonadota bacterium]
MTTIDHWLDAERARSLLTAAVPRVFSAILILLAFWVVWRSTRPLLRGVLVRAGFADALIDMLVEGLYKGSLIVVALITSASQVGINVAAALAGLGVAGIALGFAAQETVANMIAGFLVFWDRPFKIGDYITTLDQYGRVQEITMRTTRIRTMENTYVIIPNKQIIGDMLVNHSLYGEMRINVPIGIAYKESIARTRAVLLPVINGIPGVLSQPPAEVVAWSLGDSSVNLQARAWIADAAAERSTQFALLEACKQALDDAGIEIPFPHVQLFVEHVSEQALRGLATLSRSTS